MTDLVPGAELRILVFGQSNATGEHLADPLQAWPKLVAAELGAHLKRPTSLVIRPIYVHAPGVEKYLDRELERYRPDVVLLGASAFAFAQKMVVVSVRRRFGNRVASGYQWLESRADRTTRHSEAGTRANRLARRTMIKLFGAEPVAAYATVIDGLAAALKRLAREEQLSVTVFQMNPIAAADGDAAISKQIAAFDAEVLEMAHRWHFALLDIRAPMNNAPDQGSMLFPDRLHYTRRAHRIMADCVLRAFADGTIPVPG